MVKIYTKNVNYLDAEEEGLKTETWAGDKTRKNQIKPKYQLPDEQGNYKWQFTSRLVASVFCENSEPNIKTEVHHIDKNPKNNRHNNLLWVSPSEHKLLDFGKRLYVYDPDNRSLVNFNTIQSLCDYLKADRQKLNKILYQKKPLFSLDNSIFV